jgi:mercuric ion transport protein
MSHRVELIFDRDCPNAEPTRERLREVMAALGRPREWAEWDRADPAAPPTAGEYASPTILVDGKDVAQGAPVAAQGCRVYQQPDGTLSGVPPVEALRQALATDTPR